MKDDNYIKANNARSLWHPMTSPSDSLKNPPAIIVSAAGTRITDIDGHEVVDGVGGLWNVNLGYSCQPVKDAISAQLDRLPYYSIFRGTSNDVVIELSEELRKFFEPDGLTRAFYTSGGSESVETAYSLSVGGPIMHPESREILVTPVAPHLAPANSILLPEGSIVEVEIARGQKAIASIDGQPDMELSGGDIVRVRTSEHAARFLRLGPPGDFFVRVGRRLNWLSE